MEPRQECAKTKYGYPSVETLVFAFVKASSLIGKNHPLYSDIKQLANGKRRLYGYWDKPSTRQRNNSEDFPGVALILEKELARVWASPEIASEVATRLLDYVRSYLEDFVRTISAANITTAQVVTHLRPLFFAQRLAVDLSWLEQKWGIGLLPRMLVKTSLTSANRQLGPVATALRWIRRLEKQTAAGAAVAAGRVPAEVQRLMDRWENGRHLPRADSFELIRELYGMDKNVRYRFWFWIALLLEQAGEDFRQEIASCLGRGFDLATAQRPFAELSNSRITNMGVPDSFTKLEKLLCRQGVVRTENDLSNALEALEELTQFVAMHDGIAEYHVYAMSARIAVFSREPVKARDFYIGAISLARYAEPNAAERISRELAALCAHEGYAVPLKNVTDTQWLFGLHPIQIRKMPYGDDETLESATNMKRAFDYVRYFPPQAFFDRADVPASTAQNK